LVHLFLWVALVWMPAFAGMTPTFVDENGSAPTPTKERR